MTIGHERDVDQFLGHFDTYGNHRGLLQRPLPAPCVFIDTYFVSN